MKAIEKHVVKYGLLTTGALIAYFLLMRLVGLAEIVELRTLNAPIMFAGIFLMIKEFKKQSFDVEFGYLTGIVAGFFSGMVTAITFSLFIALYLTLDPAFLNLITESGSNRDFLSPFTASIVVLVEAMASGFLFSYAALQFLKLQLAQRIQPG